MSTNQNHPIGHVNSLTCVLIFSAIFFLIVLVSSDTLSPGKDLDYLYHDAVKTKNDLALSLTDSYEIFGAHAEAQNKADKAFKKLKKAVEETPEEEVPVEVKNFISDGFFSQSHQRAN